MPDDLLKGDTAAPVASEADSRDTVERQADMLQEPAKCQKVIGRKLLKSLKSFKGA